MKKFKNTFKRVETKYLLTQAQYHFIQEAMRTHMRPDQFSESQIANIYYDTPNYYLIRQSLEKPTFKEKLRVRSYVAEPTSQDTVYIELKKKVNKVVYKRRLQSSVENAVAYLEGNHDVIQASQIKDEINWFTQIYEHLQPTMYIYYDRKSYIGIEDTDLRITFDTNLIYRWDDLSLTKGVYGEPLLPEDKVLMEVKVAGGYPIWLIGILTEMQVYKSSFSKYGAAYKQMKKARVALNEYIV